MISCDLKMQHKGMNEYKVMMKLEKNSTAIIEKRVGGAVSGTRQWSESGRQKGR